MAAPCLKYGDKIAECDGQAPGTPGAPGIDGQGRGAQAPGFPGAPGSGAPAAGPGPRPRARPPILGPRLPPPAPNPGPRAPRLTTSRALINQLRRQPSTRNSLSSKS